MPRAQRIAPSFSPGNLGALSRNQWILKATLSSRMSDLIECKRHEICASVLISVA